MKFPADRVILEIKTSRTGEETPEAMVQFLSSLVELKKRLFYFVKKGIPITLELVTLDQKIHFYITVPQEYKNFIESQLISQYPKALILPSRDYTESFLESRKTLALGQLKLSHGHLYPIKTFSEFKDVDPLSSTLSMLSKTTPGDKIAIQILLIPISDSWKARGEHAISSKSTDSSGASHTNPYSKVITEKIATHGFKTAIRILTNSEELHRSSHLLMEVAHSFSSYNNPSGNSLVLRKPHLWQRDRLLSALQQHINFSD